MTWYSFRGRRREAYALVRYWDDTMRRRPATLVPPPDVDEDLASLVRALHPATTPAPERPAYADDLLRRLMAIYEETPSMNTTALAPPHAVPNLAPWHGATPHQFPLRRERLRRGLVPALGIALILALIIASLGVFWVSTNDNRRVIAPTDATPTVESSPVTSTDVPMYRGNPERTGVMPGPGIEGDPVELWHLEFGGPINSAPAIVDGVLYIGVGDGGLHAIEAATGATIWTFTAASPISSSPAVADGVVYVGSSAGTLYALDATNGGEVWTFPGTRADASVAVLEGVVYTGSIDGFLFALDAASGAEIWRASLGAAASRSPAVSDGVVYMGSADGVLHTFDAVTGEPGWNVQLDGDGVVSTTVVTGGVVYEGTFEGSENYFFALDAVTGDELWRFDSPSGLGFFTAASDGKTVYTVSEDTHVYALDAATGEETWRFETGDVVSAAPALVDDTLYVAGTDGLLYALDAATGFERWQYSIDGATDYGPVVTGGVAYVGTKFGALHAVNGSELTTLAFPENDAGSATPAATPAAIASPAVTASLATFVWEADAVAVETGWPSAPVVAPDGTIWWADGGLSQFHLFAPDGTYLESWGTTGSGEGEFTFTMSGNPGDGYGEIAFAPDGSFYVVDSGNRRVQHFSEDREFLRLWGEFGPEDGQFVKPIGLTVDSAGHVFVIDEAREDIQKFDAGGTHLLTFGGPGSEPGRLDFPGWITLGPDGTLWVGDAENHRIQQFDTEGQVLAVLDGEGALVAPVDVAVTEDGYLLVADEGAGRVVILDPGGAVIGYLGEGDGPEGLHFPWLIASDGDGNVLVTDYIHVSPPEGRLVKFRLDPPLVDEAAATPAP